MLYLKDNWRSCEHAHMCLDVHESGKTDEDDIQMSEF